MSQQPQTPSTTYLDYMEKEVAGRKEKAEAAGTEAAGSPNYPGQQVIWRMIQ